MPKKSNHKRVLFIATLQPSSVTGSSLASSVLLSELKGHYLVDVIDFSKGSLVNGVNSFSRIVSVLKILISIFVKSLRTDMIYLVISQSIAGNIKDLLTYVLCFSRLDRMLIHLHGGGISSTVFEKYSLLEAVNRFFLKRIGGAIVLGPSLVNIFKGRVSSERIHVIPNFSEDYLFCDEQEIEKKFCNIKPMRILFLSNLIDGKGHNELLDAYKSLDEKLKNEIELHYAGSIQSEDDKKRILQAVEEERTIFYHGTVTGEEKRKLLAGAHVFCLPTYYPYEGQPISILEAYASGCVVLTTDQGGIGDIFENNINGFLVEKRSSGSIRTVIQMMLEKEFVDGGRMTRVALFNRQLAFKNFRTSIFASSILKLIKSLES